MSTRICVKNIPRYITDDKLREHFAQKGEVTDAKIIKTRDGRTRQFGFVGYKSEDEAVEAVKYFHRTFFDTSRLACEVAQPIGSQDLPRPWSRHSHGSSAFEAKTTIDENPGESTGHKKGATQSSALKKSNSQDDSNPELEEFLQLMQPRAKTKIWANDTEVGSGKLGTSYNSKGFDNANRSSNKVEVRTVEAFARRVPINKGTTSEKLTQFHVRFDEESESDGDQEILAEPLLDRRKEDLAIEEKPTLNADKKDEPVSDERLSDLQYLKSRVKGNWSEDEDEVEDEDEGWNDKVDEDDEGDVDEDENEEEEEGEGEGEGDVGVEEEEEDKDCLDKLSNEKGEDHAVKFEINEERGLNKMSPNVVADGHKTKNISWDSTRHLGIEVVPPPVDADEAETVSETGRLFIRNLPYTASEEDLSELFSKFGQLSQVHLVLDKETKHSKGFAYVLFMLPEDAVRAMEKLDKSIFQGRLLHILAAKRPPPTELKAQAVAGTTKYKMERESQRKASEASGDTRAWNTLFLRPDTVAENVAKKYGMTKSQFLDPEAEDLAVRMALGETHIIAVTKRALSEEGVNVAVLDDMASGKMGTVERSDRVILVKNLPFTVSEDDLLRMFSPHGTIGRFILPPTKTLALVEYLEAAEARRAFKSIAYKRYQHVPLYLEWAPVNLLQMAGPQSSHGTESGKVVGKVVGQDLLKRAEIEQNLTGISEGDMDQSSSQAKSIFVKNLNFGTSQENLKKHFQHLMKSGSIRNVTIKTKPSKTGKMLSMGFGFIELDSNQTAAELCKQLQGTVLEGHALILQLSHLKTGTQAASQEIKGLKKGDKGQSSTKVIIRNVAFEATRKDLQQLFNPFGQVKSLRLPKKFDGNHRGFAFVEFMTRKEAETAFNGLQNTHLYGRHLVLERAKDAESLDELRARTAKSFFAENGVEESNGTSRKRRKVSFALNEDE